MAQIKTEEQSSNTCGEPRIPFAVAYIVGLDFAECQAVSWSV